MTNHLAWKQVPGLQHADFDAVNALGAGEAGAPAPSGNALRRAAEAFDYVVCRQKKLVSVQAQTLRAVTGGPSAATIVWPGYFRTGANVNAVVVRVGITKTPFPAVSPPELNVNFRDAATSTLVNANGQGRIYFDGANAGSTVTPDEISHQAFVIEGFSSDTEYRFECQCTQGMTLVYMTVHEAEVRHADDSVLGVVSPAKYQAGAPIYDEHAQDLIAANNALWRQNGAHLIQWCAPYDIADASSSPLATVSGPIPYTEVTAAPRLHLPLAARTTRRRISLGVKMAVLAQRTVGSGTLDVRLTDGSNFLALTGIGAGSISTWATVTGEMLAADSTWWLEARTSSVSTFRIYAVSLFPYEP